MKCEDIEMTSKSKKSSLWGRCFLRGDIATELESRDKANSSAVQDVERKVLAAHQKQVGVKRN